MKKVTSSPVINIWNTLPSIIHEEQVKSLIRVSKTELYEMVDHGILPEPHGTASRFWFKSDIGAYIAASHERKKPKKPIKTGQKPQRITLEGDIYNRIIIKCGQPTLFFTIQLSFAQPTDQMDIENWNNKNSGNVRKMLELIPHDVFKDALRGHFDPKTDFRYVLVAENVSHSGKSMVPWHLHGLLFLSKNEIKIFREKQKQIEKRINKTLRSHNLNYAPLMLPVKTNSVIRYTLKHVDKDPRNFATNIL